MNIQGENSNQFVYKDVVMWLISPFYVYSSYTAHYMLLNVSDMVGRVLLNTRC